MSETKKQNLLGYLLRHRYHTIPPLIIITFIAMVLLSYAHSPNQYKEIKVFHISNLGNWQEGVGFFSSGMITIGALIFTLTGELLVQRLKYESCDRKMGWVYAVYKLGSVVLLVGLVVTGCFQQSHNKPAHTIGVCVLVVGFVIMFLCEMIYYWSTRKCHGCFVLQLLIATVTLVSGIGFLTTHYTSKVEWNAGKDAALKAMNISVCLGRSVNERLNGAPYPNYYPCKSKTLWLPEDPGWKSYQMSMWFEIFMFAALSLYPLTYWGFLDDKKEMPHWFPKSGSTSDAEAGEPMMSRPGGDVLQDEPAGE